MSMARALRGLAFVGPLLEALAVWQQLAWHAGHGDAEPAPLVLAHAPIGAACALGLVGACAWLSDPRRRAAVVLVALGACVRLAAFGVDLWLHAHGVFPLAAHDAYRSGIALGLAGALVGAVREAVTWRRVGVRAPR